MLKIGFILKRNYKFLVIIFLIAAGTYAVLWRNNGELSTLIKSTISTSTNYFLSEEAYNEMGFLVNSSVCKIPAISPWDPSVLPFISKTPPEINCREDRLHWTHVNKSKIVLNETAIWESGHVPTNIFCCYRTISRDEKLKDIDGHGTFSLVVDSRIVYSSDCVPIDTETEPTAEFIFVTCEPINLDWYYADRVMTSKVVYRNFHALVPQIPSPRIKKKLDHWMEKEKRRGSDPGDLRPPNVIMLGLDATSRLNFRRSMPRTIKILEELGSHEMLGYTKVGENTWPNVVPLMTGYDEDDFARACYYSRQTKFDDCPFIWKRFSEAGYLTAEIQDSPRRNSWNFQKAGFVEPPTDFYFRPFIVAVHMNAGFFPYNVDCIGDKTVEKTIWNYIEDIAEFGKGKGTPIFINAWLNQLGHDSLNSLQFGDEELAGMLEGLLSNGTLDNTILILVADHGYRYGGIRQTIAGYYEDKLPLLWIRLPPPVIKRFPEWETALSVNSRRLTGPFDIYTAHNHILNTFAPETKEIVSKTRSGDELPRTIGNSLFREVNPERSCRDAGIPDSFCACNFPIRLPVEDDRLLEAAAASVLYLNSKMPSECSQLTLERVKGGALLNKVTLETQEELIVEFVTNPGEFVLEATVTRYGPGRYSVKNNVQRLSQFQMEVTCIDDAVRQLYCHCK